MRVVTSVFIVSVLLVALVCDVVVARRSGGIGGSRRTSSSSSSGKGAFINDVTQVNNLGLCC